MARNRKNDPAAWLGPALKAGLICAAIVGACVGYVWQKQQINVLAEKKGRMESRLRLLREQNLKLHNQLDTLYSPEQLDLRVKELKLGLAPAQPNQIWYRNEPPGAAPQPKSETRIASTSNTADDSIP